MKSEFMRVYTYIILALGILGTIIYTIKLESFIMFIIGTISIAVAIVPLFAITEILRNTEDIQYSLYRVKQGTSTALSGATVTEKKNVSTWKCPECDTINPSSSRICKDCGYER